MDLFEAGARLSRLQSAMWDLEQAERQCSLGDAACRLPAPVRARLQSGMWTGPAFERACAGHGIIEAQCAVVRDEVADLAAMARRGRDAAGEVVLVLQSAVRAAEAAGSMVVDDRAASWPAYRPSPLPPGPFRAPEEAPAPGSGGVSGFVGLDVGAARDLVADLRRLDMAASGLAFQSGFLSGRIGAALEQIRDDVVGTPATFWDREWMRCGRRLTHAGRWAQETAKDLEWRIGIIAGADPAPPAGGMSTADFVFADPGAATRAGVADAKAIQKILGQGGVDLTGRRQYGRQQLEDLTAALEATAARAYDPAYCAGLLNRLGPDGVSAALDAARYAGPEAEARLFGLIASATRSGTLDSDVEKAILHHESLDRLAQGERASRRISPSGPPTASSTRCAGSTAPHLRTSPPPTTSRPPTGSVRASTPTTWRRPWATHCSPPTCWPTSPAWRWPPMPATRPRNTCSTA